MFDRRKRSGLCGDRHGLSRKAGCAWSGDEEIKVIKGKE
jgi:hypothetical protein